jgi:hypothetical protein
VFVVVLGAAVLHAAWNALVKQGGDPFLRLAVVDLTGSAICLPFLLVVPPPVAAAWPWLLASVAIHVGYCATLCLAYRFGTRWRGAWRRRWLPSWPGSWPAKRRAGAASPP